MLSQYYAKARMYDAGDRRFTSIDPILGGTRYDLREYLSNPGQLVQYLYVRSNPPIYTDPLGLNSLAIVGKEIGSLTYQGAAYSIIEIAATSVGTAAAAIGGGGVIAVMAVGIGVCYIIGSAAYHSPAIETEKVDISAVVSARKNGEYFDTYPGTEIDPGIWDVHYENWNVPNFDNPQENSQTTNTIDTPIKTYLEQLDCDGQDIFDTGVMEFRLPSWKKVTVDMPHILSGRTTGGGRGDGNKDKWPDGMTATAI